MEEPAAGPPSSRTLWAQLALYYPVRTWLVWTQANACAFYLGAVGWRAARHVSDPWSKPDKAALLFYAALLAASAVADGRRHARRAALRQVAV